MRDALIRPPSRGWEGSAPRPSHPRRRAHRIKPPADINLGMRLAAEVPRRRAVRSLQVPLVDRERLVSALDHKPMHGIGFDDPTNLALKLFQCAHNPEVLSPVRELYSSLPCPPPPPQSTLGDTGARPSGREAAEEESPRHKPWEANREAASSRCGERQAYHAAEQPCRRREFFCKQFTIANHPA